MKSSPIKIRAKVVEGPGRGRRLGIPTINLDPQAAGILEEGIWVCQALFPQAFWGVLHFGPRPVFNEEEKTLEVYLFDFDKNLQVPLHLDLEVFDYIREVADFESPKKLIERIEEDIRVAKQKIKSYQIR